MTHSRLIVDVRTHMPLLIILCLVGATLLSCDKFARFRVESPEIEQIDADKLKYIRNYGPFELRFEVWSIFGPGVSAEDAPAITLEFDSVRQSGTYDWRSVELSCGGLAYDVRSVSVNGSSIDTSMVAIPIENDRTVVAIHFVAQNIGACEAASLTCDMGYVEMDEPIGSIVPLGVYNCKVVKE